MEKPVIVEKRWFLALTPREYKKLFKLDYDLGNSNSPYNQMFAIPDIYDIDYDGNGICFTTFNDESEQQAISDITILIKKILGIK